MTGDSLRELVADPSRLDSDSMTLLRELNARYPYFRTPQLLLAKNLRDLNHIDQRRQLHLTAIYAADRALLRALLDGRFPAKAPVPGFLTETDSSDVKAENDGVKADSADAQANIADVEINRGDVEVNRAEVEENVSDIDMNIGDVEENIAEVEVNSGDVQENIAEVEMNRAEVEENVSDVDMNIDDVEVNIAEVEVNRAEVEENVSDADMNIGDVEKNIAEVEENIGDVEVNIADVEANSGDVDMNIGDIEVSRADVEANGGDVAADDDPFSLIPEPILYRIEDLLNTDALPPSPREPSTGAEPDALPFDQWLNRFSGQPPPTESEVGNQRPQIADHEPGTGNRQSGISNRQSAVPRPNPKDNLALIEDFLSSLPKEGQGKRAEFFRPSRAAERSNTPDHDAVSETLADIYMRQGQFEMAAKAFDALAKHHPQKSSYFAARKKEALDKVD